MRKPASIGGLFLGFALATFLLVSARPAEAVKRNYAGIGCWQYFDGTFNNYYCPVMTDFSNYTTGAIQGAYFDFTCVSGGTTAFYALHKVTSTGSAYHDVKSYACTAYGAQDKWLGAVNVKLNPNARGYIWATAFNVGELYGVQSQFTTIEPH